MKVRRFAGRDLAAALDAVRRSLGDDALILETQHLDAGVEILAAMEPTFEEAAPLDIPIVADTDLDADRHLDERRAHLAWHGVSADLTARLTEKDLAHALSRRLSFASLVTPSHAPPLFFAGEPGAGKSLSLIKIATRLVMEGVQPLVISTDGQKAGATEQLAAMTRILGLTLIVADRPSTLQRAVAMRKNGAPVLIDGQGTVANDEADGASMSALFGSVEAEIILVVPAGLDPAETVDITAHYAALGARRMIATRLDVARRVGGIVEAAWRSRLMLTEAGQSSGIVDGLTPITPQLLAGRLQRRAQRQIRTTPRRCVMMSGVEHDI